MSFLILLPAYRLIQSSTSKRPSLLTLESKKSIWGWVPTKILKVTLSY